MTAPGAYRPTKDRWGDFADLSRELDGPVLQVIDAKVARLHPNAIVPAATAVRVKAGEEAKSFVTLANVLRHGSTLPRKGTLLAVGGGTIGDLATVAAHLLKRGVRLIHVPTTLLAAVDSSLGGKGAVHVDGVKNAAGVFHYAEEAWLCPAFFETLPEKQRREGRIEALKMAVCLSPALWREPPSDDVSLTRAARAIKEKVCAKDPYDLHGHRAILNFGHTFGHVIETLSDFRISHGDAVGLGMLCALDVGRLGGMTPPSLADELESKLPVLPRKRLVPLFATSDQKIETLLRADKKSDSSIRMILLERIGRARLVPIEPTLWRKALASWRRGEWP